MMPTDEKLLLTEHSVSARIEVPVATLRDWRIDRKGPPFVKIGRLVRYDPDALSSWVKSLSETNVTHIGSRRSA